MMCNKCSSISGWIFLILGVLYLIQDFGAWNIKIQWYTALFIIWGIVSIAGSCCKECAVPDKKKK